MIDLKANPGVLIEILRNFGHVLDDDGTGGGGGGMMGVGGGEGMGPGGPGPGDDGGGGCGGVCGGEGGVGGGGGVDTVSSIAVAGPDASERVQLDEVMRAVLALHKEVRTLAKDVKALRAGGIG